MSARPRPSTAGSKVPNVRTRLEAIEDRKIEILLGIAEVNREYEVRVSALEEEYARLDEEQLRIRLERMRLREEAEALTSTR